MGTVENAFAPGPQKIALSVEHHHGMFAAVEDIDLILAVNGDAGDIPELPAIGQFGPILGDPVTVVTVSQYERHLISSL